MALSRSRDGSLQDNIPVLHQSLTPNDAHSVKLFISVAVPQTSKSYKVCEAKNNLNEKKMNKHTGFFNGIKN